MDSEREIEVQNTCKNLATYYINCILELKVPEIIEDYPEFPKNCPKELLFDHQNFIKKEPVIRKKTNDKKNVKIEKQKVPENNKKTARKCRFTGTYDIKKRLSEIVSETKQEPEEQVPGTSENGAKSSEDNFFKALGMQKSNTIILSESEQSIKENNSDVIGVKKRKVRALSDTSSSSDEEDISKDLTKNKSLLKNVPSPLIKVCDRNTIKTDKPQVKNVIKNQVTSRSAENKPQNSKVLKSIFQNSTSFDEAMQRYSEKKKKLDEKVIPPKVIPPPEFDPTLKKSVIKRKQKKVNEDKANEINANKHLGGIFTITNGWDKNENNSQSESEVKNENHSKIIRKITPPNIVIDTNDVDDIMAAHEMYTESFLDNMLIPQYSNTSLSNSPCQNLKHTPSNDFTSDKNYSNKPIGKIQSSINSSEDYESDEEENLKPSKKVQRLSYSDESDEEEKESGNFKRATQKDHDVITLCADDGDLDLFVDESEQMYAEVDDLKLKVCVKRKVDPLDHQTEFDLNTKEISQHMVDPETDKILKTVFGNACPAFLENRCSMPGCTRKHSVPEESKVRPMIINATFDVLQSVFQVALRFHRLFQTYITIFVEICIKNKDDQGLIELVKACDRFPRTIVCYRDIVRKLVELDYMKEHRAISFIITHHTDSEIARDTILSLILDSGPCLAFFMDYIEKIHIKQPIRSDMFSRILHTCVAYQNPKLPNFCLNYLQGCSLSQMNTMNSEHLKAFLQMNKCLSELNEHRESKALTITKKLLNSGNW